MPPITPKPQLPWSRILFLLSCFLLPGLIGTFASFAIPAPTIDEIHQNNALNAILNAPNPTAQTTAINNLPNNIEPDAATLITTSTAPLPTRIAAARTKIQTDILAEARNEAYKIRLMVITITTLAALFGIALLGPAKS